MSAAAARAGRFVGRQRELAELRDWLTDAQAGSGRMALIRGEPGVGKTRLAEELAATAHAAGVPVAWCRCSGDAGTPPLWPLRRLVEQLPGGPGWMTSDGDGFGSAAEGSAAARFAQSVRVADIVVRAARPAGLLVIVEDLHWADSGTAASLGHLSTELRRSRALVVVTARPLADSPAVTTLLDRPAVEQRQLSGLNRPEILDYLRSVAGGPVDERYADLVHRQSAGNSLFVGAVVRLLTEQVSLRHYDPTASRNALAGRPELTDLVREPMGRLSAACRGLVETASVAGEEFSLVELTAAYGVPADVMLGLLDEAVRSGLLLIPIDAPQRGRFLHALVREGVYDNFDRAARSRAHRALAAAVEATDPERARIATVASHLARGATTAAEHVRAAAYAREAGDAALADLAYTEAAAQFGSVLNSLAMAGALSPTERAEVLLELAFAEYRSGAFGSSLGHCALAADLAEAELRWDLLGRAALLVDGVTPPDFVTSLVGLCSRALELVPDEQLSLRAQLLARLAYAAADHGDLDRAVQLSADALRLAQETADPAALLAVLRARHQALVGPGFAADRRDLGARAIELAGHGEPLGALWGRIWRIDAAFELGDLVAVDVELAALTRLAAELRFPLARWHLFRLRAARDALVGRFAAAREHADAARALAEEIEDPSSVGLSYAFEQHVGYTRGAALAAGALDFVRAAAAGIPMPIMFASVARVLVRAGDVEEAARMVRALCTGAGEWPRDGRWLVTMALVADVIADVDAGDCAQVLYPLLVPFSELTVTSGAGTVACEGSVSRFLGRLAVTSAQLATAERHFRDAITFDQRMGGRPFVALSRMYLADVLHARGGAQRLVTAAQTARIALAAMRALDMPGRAAQCEAVVAAIDADLAQRSALTPREREIVGLIGAGLSNRKIAERLFVSERTVETHVSHVLAKVGGTSRTDILAWSHATGTPRPAADTGGDWLLTPRSPDREVGSNGDRQSQPHDRC
ncbi:MAG: AAA family ATPase [Geodermatophilaceae bacterium]|nr:AAA family ATPase [Geodermatophilaceae bacterium]